MPLSHLERFFQCGVQPPAFINVTWVFVSQLGYYISIGIQYFNKVFIR